MAIIRSLFDGARALNRPIEKVITYQAASEDQLKAEVSEYVVTDHIEESFDHLLKLMQAARQGGAQEVGVWVSGFYGSGKSSFTKYLGFALERDKKVAGEPFLQLLQNRLNTAPVRALFNTVSAAYDPQVIFLDLASEMLAEASMADISTVLYRKVLQWAGYSEDIKIAELERMLEKDRKLVDFVKRAGAEADGEPWSQVHNQPLVANVIASRLAREFYPKLFKSDDDFANLAVNMVKTEHERVTEMLELVFRKSGKKNVFFIIDEVGQYASAKPNLILNLDGLAKNLKQIGGGRAWIFATAQQTLTEDNPSATLNAPGLFKLKDRFPIQIHLEASDIKEICHKRLLTKSAAGEAALGKIFDDYGPSLRTATALKDAGVYEQPLDRRTFIDLYPFLPAHFEILLQLLGRLARKTGGLGLRSAIKVLQDVLLDCGGRAAGETALADAEVGALANTVTFYDSLRHDLQSSYGHIVEGVAKVSDRFNGKKLHQDVAKSIAILQVLENIPVNARNIAALLQPEVKAPSLGDQVRRVVEDLLKDGYVPLGEKNESLRFLTQAAVTLQKEFDQIEYRNAEVRAELNRSLAALFQPLPSVRLGGARLVTAGLRAVVPGGQSVGLEGEKEPIQLQVEFVAASNYDLTRKDRENDSRAASQRAAIFLLGRSDSEADKLAVTLVRCRRFMDQHKNAGDPEAQEFVRIVAERAERTARELETRLQTALQAGSFVAHGASRPVSELAPDLADAARIYLAEAAAKIFDRYAEAAFQADGGLAEKFLKTPLDRISAADDPLQFITRPGGHAQIKRDHKALLSIKDWLNQVVQAEGRRLLEHFNEPPFGWSKDTTRYALAALFLATEVKLRIGGADHAIKNDETLAALGSNKALGPVGVSLREDKPAPEALDRASQRLGDLTGENVLPLEDVIATAAKKHFPGFQLDYSALATELANLNLPGSERATDLSEDLTEVSKGDGSDAVKRLGGETSPLFESLQWAQEIKKAFGHGLKETVAHLQELRSEIARLPDSGVPGKLKTDSTERLARVADFLARDSFFQEMPALREARAELEKLLVSAVGDFAAEQNHLRHAEIDQWQSGQDWIDLNADDRAWISGEVEKLARTAPATLAGFRQLLAHDYDLTKRLAALALEVARRAAAERAIRAGPSEDDEVEPIKDEVLYLSATMTKIEDVDRLISQLQKLREQMSAGKRVRVLPRILGETSGTSAMTYP
jgi:hypothetical protein